VSPTLDYQTAEWADGVALMGWLEGRAKVLATDAAERRRLQRWRAGAQAKFADVDQVLVRAGLSVSEVPDHVWRRYDNGRRRRVLEQEAA
jgi:hypothetical protein